MTAARPPAAVALTWGRRPDRRTGPKPALSVERIARAAVVVADRHGSHAVTMGAVAGRLGCTKMALYRHLAGKEDLVAVMFDAAIGPPPPPAEAAHWRARLRAWAAALLDRYEAHPWAVDVPLGPTVLTRNRALWLEAALVAFRGARIALPDKLSLVLLLNAHVVFTARLRRDAGAPADPDRDMLPVDALVAYGLPEVAEVVRAGHLGDGPDRDEFAWGLDRILGAAR